MNETYRGHQIILHDEDPPCAVIVELRTGAELPTKIMALPEEDLPGCVSRARRLIDIYLTAQSDVTSDDPEGAREGAGTIVHFPSPAAYGWPSR